MDEAAVPPFLRKTYEMVDDPLKNQIISWSPRQCSFVVWDPTEFSKELLPKCFRHSNFSSFIRQLNTYGFKKIDPARWEFANDDFIKCRRNLLKNIQSRKLVHNHSVQVIQELRRLSVSGSTHSEKRKLEEYAESLKHEKRLLLLEIQRQTTEHQKIKLRLQSLENCLQQMEYLQQKTVAAFAQTPDYCAFDFTHKRRRLSILKDNSFNNESVGLLCNNAHACGETLMSEIGSAVQNAGPSEINTLHGDPQSSTLLHSALPYPQAMVCSSDSMQLNADMGGDNSLGNGLSSNQIDVHEVLAWKEKSEGVGNSTLINVQAQDDSVNNDLFWEQVLIETLGSSCDLHQFLGTSDGQKYPYMYLLLNNESLYNLTLLVN